MMKLTVQWRYAIFVMGVITMVLTSCGQLLSSSPLKRVPVLDENGRGGTLTVGIGSFPKSFNAYTDNYQTVRVLFGMIYESFAFMDDETAEWRPVLAKKWEVSADGLGYKFHLDPRAKFNDDTPVTTADVMFTYNTLMNTNNLTISSRIFLSKFHPPKVLDSHTFTIRAKKLEFGNFSRVAGLEILPKHLYKEKNFNDITYELPVGSGPYVVSLVKDGYQIVLEKQTNWWGNQLSYNKDTYHFAKIRFKSYGERDGAVYEAFKKGEVQTYEVYKADRWAKETAISKVSNHYIVKQEIYSQKSRTVQGLFFNLRRPIFQDKRVRLALAHLFNRKGMVSSFMHNQYELLSSYNPSHIKRPDDKIVDFDPKKALKLLQEAGWTETDKDGILIKDDKRFEFTIPYFAAGMERYFTIYKEDCQKAGVQVNLKRISWASFSKSQENYDFDALTQARYAGYLFFRPEALMAFEACGCPEWRKYNRI